jgi:ATP-binding cassette subfamily B protein
VKALTWRHAWGLARNHPWAYAGGGVGMSVFYGLALAPGLITRSIFNALSGHASAGFNVWSLIGLMLAIEFARLAALYAGNVFINIFAYASEALLKWNMLRWLVCAPGARALPGSTGEAVSRFRDDPMETVNFAAFVGLLPQLITGIVGFAVMLSINAAITVVVVLPLTATVAVTYMLTRGIQRYRKAAREATAEVTGFIGETFGAVQAVKLAGAEAHLVERLSSLNDRRRDASIRDLMFSTGLASFNANLAALGSGFVLLLAAQAMRAGAFTVGDFTLFASYLGLASVSPLIVGQVLAMERQSRVSITRMRTLADGAPPLGLVEPRRPLPAIVAGGPDLALDVLTARGLTRLHPGSERGVRDVDLTLRRGGFVVVTGPVGSGKTTLLRTLLGLIPRDAGEIAWNGRVVDDPSTFMTPPRCAYTAQSPRLFSETLGENVLMGAAAGPEALAAAIELAVFEDDVAGFEDGLDTRVGTRGVTLSGGQLQRAAAARMFVRGADLLVFDDVSSALDVGTEQTLWRRLFASGERTCLAVSHRREAFRRADEIVVLDEGRIVARGDADTLLARSPLFRRIWGEED